MQDDRSLKIKEQIKKYLQIAAEEKLPALVMLCEIAENPTLTFITELVWRMEESSQEELAYIVPSTLNILLRTIKSPFDTKQKRDYSWPPDLAAFKLVTRLVDNQAFKDYKKMVLVNDTQHSYTIALQLLEVCQSPLATQNNNSALRNKIYDNALELLQMSRAGGMVAAHWKFLGLQKQNEYASTLLDEAIAVTNQFPEQQIACQELIESVVSKIDASDCDHALKARLGLLYAQGLSNSIKKDEQKAFAILSKAKEYGRGVLVIHADEFTNILVCSQAVRYLLRDKKLTREADQVQLERALTHYIKKTAQASLSVKKDVIRSCLSDATLFPMILSMFEEVCQDLHNRSVIDDKCWQRESQFFKEIIPVIVQQAKLECDASRYVIYRYVKEYGQPLSANVEADRVFAQECLERSAFNGCKQALAIIAPQYETVANTLEAYTKAGEYWYALWGSYIGQASQPEISQRCEEIIEAVHNLSTMWDIQVKAKTFKPQSPIFNYMASMILAQKHPEQALQLFIQAQEILTAQGTDNNQLFDLYFTTGMSTALTFYAQSGSGWAWYAMALEKYIRGNIIGDHQSAEQNILEVQAINAMLDRAAQAQEPFTNFAQILSGDLDYILGVQHEHLLQAARNGRQVNEKAIEYYQKAASAGNIKALYVLAEYMLVGLLPNHTKGQESLEWGLRLLMQAADGDYTDALARIESILQKRYTFGAGCGGSMTQELLQQLENCVERSNQRAAAKAQATEGVTVARASVSPDLSIFDEVLIPIERAKKFIGAKKYAQAFDLLMQQTAQENPDPIALVYLGILQRDGLVGEKNQTAAYDYFKKALYSWDPKQTANLIELNIAYEGLRDLCATDLDAALARLKFSSVVLARTQETNIGDDFFNQFNAAEQLAAQSNNTHERDRIFTSGVGVLIRDLYQKRNSPVVLFETIKHLSVRMRAGFNALQGSQEENDRMLALYDFGETLPDIITQKRFYYSLRFR